MKIAIIGGTGLERMALDHAEVLTVETRWGAPSGPIIKGDMKGQTVFFLNRHGPEHTIPPHCINYRANIAALHQLGVDAVVAINAVGGITQTMGAGVLVVPDQLIDYTWGREFTYIDCVDTALEHMDFTFPYHGGMRKALLSAAARCGMKLFDSGVYGVVQGPRLETAAEIVRLERDGCDLVGMTGMPEAALARELDIPYACLALVVNPAAGKSLDPITVAQIREVMESSIPRLKCLLVSLCEHPPNLGNHRYSSG